MYKTGHCSLQFSFILYTLSGMDLFYSILYLDFMVMFYHIIYLDIYIVLPILDDLISPKASLSPMKMKYRFDSRHLKSFAKSCGQTP